jgi:hypothetical protein
VQNPRTTTRYERSRRGMPLSGVCFT